MEEQYRTSAGDTRYVHGSKNENIISEEYWGLFNKQYNQQQNFPKLIQYKFLNITLWLETLHSPE